MAIEWLLQKMKEWHDLVAVVSNECSTTYGDLLDLTRKWEQRLIELSIQPGSVVAIQGDYSPSSCALLLALINRNVIVVPLTESVAAHIEEFLEVAEVEHVFRFLENDEWKMEDCHRAAKHELIEKLRTAKTPGLVLFSSASTGKSKAALHDFKALLEKFKVPRQRMVTMTFLLLDHIGGINTLFYTLSNGGTVVVTGSRDPEEVCRLIAKNRVELLPTSPTFLNLLLMSEAYEHHDITPLKLITYGTEVMPENTLQRLHAVLPDIRLQQTYGLSELGILRSKSRDSGSLWVKIGGEGFETKVVNGILWVRAQSAMLGYLNAPSPFDAEGWMNTGDMVEMDGEYFRILGRKSEIINVGGQKVYPGEVESVLMQMNNIRDVVVSGEANTITGRMVVARVNLFEPEDPIELKKRMVVFCRDKMARYKVPMKIYIAEEPLFSGRYKKIRNFGTVANGSQPHAVEQAAAR